MLKMHALKIINIGKVEWDKVELGMTDQRGGGVAVTVRQHHRAYRTVQGGCKNRAAESEVDRGGSEVL